MNASKSTDYLKQEIHNRFNSISEERVNIFKHNSAQNLMKIGWNNNGSYDIWSFANFQETFLDQSILNMQMSEKNDVIASQFSIHFVHRNDQKFHSCQLMRMLDLPLFLSEYRMQPWMLLTLNILIWGTCYHKLWRKISKFSKFYVQNDMARSVRWWHHQLTHLTYSYRAGQEMFCEKLRWTSKCHNFLIFQPIFIKFSLLCLKSIYSFFVRLS